MTAIDPPIVAVYPSFVDAALTGLVDLSSTDLFVVLVTNGYEYDPADEFLSAVSGGDRIATSSALTGTDLEGGVVTSADVVLPLVADGSDIAAWIVFLDGAGDSTRRLVTYVTRNADGTVLDVPTNGNDITLRFHPEGRVFRL